MVNVAYWWPVPVFLFLTALLLATIWVGLRLESRDPDHP
jgi:hypothetical protein